MYEGAPDVLTSPFQQCYEPAPQQDAEARVFRAQNVVQTLPVFGRQIDYSVPQTAFRYRGGWVAPDVPTTPGPTYPTATEAPNIQYNNHPYAHLVVASSVPQGNPNRPAHRVGAPSITSTF